MDAMRGRHRIARRFKFSKLERPLYVMNIGAIHFLIAYDGVEAITFSEPPLKRTLPGEGNRCYGTIGRFEFRRARAPVSATLPVGTARGTLTLRVTVSVVAVSMCLTKN